MSKLIVFISISFLAMGCDSVFRSENNNTQVVQKPGTNISGSIGPP